MKNISSVLITFNTIFIILSSSSSQCQFNFIGKTNITLSSGILVSSKKNTPFLLRANQFGTIPNESNFFYINLNAKKEYDTLYYVNQKLKPAGLGYGIEFGTNLNSKNNIYLKEAYLKFRYKIFEFYGGRRKEIQGLVDTTGTLGSYIWSGNTLPVPKIELSIPNYKSILSNGLLSIKGNFAHGWLGGGQYVNNVLLHQKSLYAKIGKSSWRINILGGFNHQAQWGGIPKEPYIDELTNIRYDKFSTSFSTFIKTISGLSISKLNRNNSSLPSNESTNRIGNHLGTVDIGINIKLKNNTLYLYRQSLFDDGSLYYLNNISDGLLGISLNNTGKLNGLGKVCFEYLNTKNQGGLGGPGNSIPQLRGTDNYFNNSIYFDGWTYKTQTIGSPYLLNLYDPNSVYLVTKKWLITNNKLQTGSIFISGSSKSISYFGRIVYNQNFGTFDNEKKANQAYILSGVEYSKKTWRYKLLFSVDSGELYEKNFGINFNVSRSLFL